MPLSQALLQNIFDIITKAVSTLLLIVLFYILQYIFNMDFVCSCSTVLHIHRHGVVYMLFPPMILTWVVSIVESFHGRKIFFKWQGLCSNHICNCIVKLLISYVTLTGVWMATVLFDGDWYFCLKTNQNASQTGIPCKKKLSDEENIIKARYKSDSLVSNNTQHSNMVIN